MTQIQKPAVGSRVSVTLKLRDYYIFNPTGWKEITLEGVVGKSDSWNNPDTFVLNVGCEHVPKRVISLEHVVALAYADGKRGETTVSGTTAKVKERVFKVKSSKGSEHLVILRGKKFTCDCVAGGFGRECKHVKAVKEQANV